jgi:hypothetical protein
MNEFFKMVTGSKLICYYDELHSLILFDIAVYTISDPKMYKIHLYDEEGQCIDVFHYYEKQTKNLIKTWHVSSSQGFGNTCPIYYKIFESKNVELNLDGTLRDVNLSIYEKLKSLANKSPISSGTPSPRSCNSTPKNVKPLTPRDVIHPSLSRTPRSSTSSSSSTPRSSRTPTPRDI